MYAHVMSLQRGTAHVVPQILGQADVMGSLSWGLKPPHQLLAFPEVRRSVYGRLHHQMVQTLGLISPRNPENNATPAAPLAVCHL